MSDLERGVWPLEESNVPTFPCKWPEGWSVPRPVLSDGSEAKAYALLASHSDSGVRGWEAFRGFYESLDEALFAVGDGEFWHSPGFWWQVVHLFTGRVVAEGSVGGPCEGVRP